MAKKPTKKRTAAAKRTATKAKSRGKKGAGTRKQAAASRKVTKAARTRKKATAKKSSPSRTSKAAPPKGAKKRARKAPPRPVKRSAKRASPPRPASRTAKAARMLTGAVAGAIAAVADKMPWTDAQPDALQMLEAEHRRLEDLLKQGEATTEAARKMRRDLLKTITAEVDRHEQKEERVLYPALQAHPEARELVSEGYQEHHVADVIIDELHAVATDDEAWGAKFKVLKENLEHHIKEEEGQMFRIARGVFSRDELQELGTRMRELWPQEAGKHPG
jgi:hemerythrin-like domain-containing protein